jgi:hypothetical protein
MVMPIAYRSALNIKPLMQLRLRIAEKILSKPAQQ